MTTPDAGAGLRPSASHRGGHAGHSRARFGVVLWRHAVNRLMPAIPLILVLVVLALAIVAAVAAPPDGRMT